MVKPVPEFAGRTVHLRQRGVTLVELMVATAVALVVVLAATAAFIASQRLFAADADAQATEESLRFASFVVRSVVRQAGYSDYAPDHQGFEGIAGSTPMKVPSNDPADLDIVGASDTRVSGIGESHGAHGSRGINASDSLRVRFFGRSRAGGKGTEPDGTMIDCMGFAQPGPAADTPTSEDRAWSFFYVAEAADKEPELYCKYRSAKGGAFRAQPLARGIEVFKVVYGHDADGDGVPEHWLDAAQLEAIAASADKVADEWRKVVGLRIGMVARSAHARGGRHEAEEVFYPLGTDFSALNFRPPPDGRLRRVMTFTVMLRNAMKGPAS
ncbi:type IV pilus assembly protein PilW [Variovorax boronicumulans]|uniref:PilW family protein n=1 Tax=Variovorax boronicumulans TaxID=436515 RepID=UPI00247654B3|nr:PilW family protein [Variovorax boronicumulans]MDH6166176.1 type IV pilus assembly protein PilW [Variovorax boronicumulans]